MNDEHSSITTDLINMSISNGDLPDGEYGELDFGNGLSYLLQKDNDIPCNPNRRKQRKKPVQSKNMKNKRDTKNFTTRSKKSQKTSMKSHEDNELTSDMSIKSNKDANDGENQPKDTEEEKTASQKDRKSGKILKTKAMHSKNLKNKAKHAKNLNVSYDENTVDELITQKLFIYDEDWVKSQREKLTKKIKEALEEHRKFYFNYIRKHRKER